MIRSSDLIDQIKDRSNIVALVGQVISLKKTGKGYLGLCPFHKEKTASFHVYEHPARFYCFGCQAHGDVLSFVQQYYNLSFPEALKRVAHEVGVELPSHETSKNDASDYKEIKEVLSLVSYHFKESLDNLPSQHLAKIMLKNRNIKPEIAQLFNIGWVGYQNRSLLSLWPKQKNALMAAGLINDNHLGEPHDRFVNRLMFPIYSTNNTVVGFGGRVVDPLLTKKYPKYLNSPETVLFKKNNLLYGLSLALKHHQFKSFLIVEGYFDVIQLFNHNLPCAVAPMGTALSENHIDLLLKYQRELIFCLDGDSAGQQAAFKAFTLLLPYYNHRVNISFVTLPQGEDPDSFLLKNGRQSFIQLCQNRVKMGEYLFQKLESLYPLDKIDNKVRFIAEAKKLIGLIQDPDARLTLLEVLRSLNIGARVSLKSRKKNPVTLSNAQPIDLLAAILAREPFLIKELDDATKNSLKTNTHHHELKNLLTLALDSEEFKEYQRIILAKYGNLVYILPKEGLKIEMEQQLKGMNIFHKNF
jgi:DNA primase